MAESLQAVPEGNGWTPFRTNSDRGVASSTTFSGGISLDKRVLIISSLISCSCFLIRSGDIWFSP